MTNTPEVVILKYICIYKYYNKYYTYIYKYLKDNKEVNNILLSISSLFENREVEVDIPLEELELFLSVKFASEYESLYKPILDSVRSITDISEETLTQVLDRIKDRQVASDLAVMALEVSEGIKFVEDLFKKMEEFSDTYLTVEDKFVSDDLEILYNDNVTKPGLRWRLNTLNQMLGSLRKGDFGFIFARPETGKTTFLASEVSFFAEQVERPILWFNNEEQGSKVMLRCYQAVLGLTLEKLLGNVQENKRRYRELVGNRIRIFDSAAISRRDVEQLCAEHEPSLVVFDQIDKIKGFEGDREDLRLGGIYIWAREIAKEYCPVIGVCQANGEGEGKAYLTMDYVSNAKTSKQAEADWILGIGKVHTEGYEYVRSLHLSKNKLTGDPDTKPDLRHGKVDVLIAPDIARYQDVRRDS